MSRKSVHSYTPLSPLRLTAAFAMAMLPNANATAEPSARVSPIKIGSHEARF